MPLLSTRHPYRTVFATAAIIAATVANAQAQDAMPSNEASGADSRGKADVFRLIRDVSEDLTVE